MFKTYLTAASFIIFLGLTQSSIASFELDSVPAVKISAIENSNATPVAQNQKATNFDADGVCPKETVSNAGQDPFRLLNLDALGCLTTHLDVRSMARLDQCARCMSSRLAILKLAASFPEVETLSLNWRLAKKSKIPHMDSRPWTVSFSVWLQELLIFRFELIHFRHKPDMFSIDTLHLTSLYNTPIKPVFKNPCIIKWRTDAKIITHRVVVSDGKSGLLVLRPPENIEDIIRQFFSDGILNDHLFDPPNYVLLPVELDPFTEVAKWLQRAGGRAPQQGVYSQLVAQSEQQKATRRQETGGDLDIAYENPNKQLSKREQIARRLKAAQEPKKQTDPVDADVKKRQSAIRELTLNQARTGDIRAIDKMLYGLTKGAHGFVRDESQVHPTLVNLCDGFEDVILSGVLRELITSRAKFSYPLTPTKIWLALGDSIKKKLDLTFLLTIRASLIALNISGGGFTAAHNYLHEVHLRIAQLFQDDPISNGDNM